MKIEIITPVDPRLLEKALDIRMPAFKNREEFLYFKVKALKQLDLKQKAVLYLAKNEKNEIAAFALVSDSQWDSKIFSFKVGRIEQLTLSRNGSLNEEFLGQITSYCRQKDYRQISCRIGLKDFMALRILEKEGFNVADIQLTLAASLPLADSETISGDNSSIRQAKLSDFDKLREVLKSGFTDTRFVTDTRFPKDKVDLLYAEWLKNALKDERREVFVILSVPSQEPFGFCICNLDRDSFNLLGLKLAAIDLIFIDKGQRGRGRGQIFLNLVLQQLKGCVDKVEIRTQVSNLTAIRAFMKAGFKEIYPGTMLPASITLHRWF